MTGKASWRLHKQVPSNNSAPGSGGGNHDDATGEILCAYRYLPLCAGSVIVAEQIEV